MPEGAHCEPGHAAAAVFYSISSTQAGLAGIDLGTFLIKQVATQLLRDFPGLQHLSTLSPMPGFSRWLATAVNQHFRGGQVRTFFMPAVIPLCCLNIHHHVCAQYRCYRAAAERRHRTSRWSIYCHNTALSRYCMI